MSQEFKNISNLGGLRTNLPEDQIPERNATDCANMDFSVQGLIQSKKGYDRLGSKITDVGTNLRGFMYKKNFGALKRIKLRVRDDGTNSHLDWFNPSSPDTSDGDWELLSGDKTQGAVMGFAPFNNTNVNQLIFSNGQDNFHTWNGATALVDSVTGVSITADTIAFVDSNPDTITDSGDGFLTAGFQAGDIINVSGTTNNNGQYTIDTVVAGTITLVGGDTLTAEGAGTDFTILAATITKSGTDTFAFEGFDATGSVLIDGTTYAYTGGTSGTTLTGVTPDPTTQNPAANKGIAQQPDGSTYSGNPKGNILLTSGARLWLSGVPTRESQMYYSEVAVATNFTAADNPDDPGIEDFPDGGGPITLLDAKQIDKNKIIIHKEDGILVFWLDYDGTNKIPYRDVLTLADDSGASNQKAGAGLNKASYFTTTREGLKSIQRASQAEDFDLNSISDAILPTIEGYDFTTAASVYYPKKRVVYVACKESSDSDYNDKIIAFYLTRSAKDATVVDVSIDEAFVADWILDGDNLFFVSSIDQNVYQFFVRKSNRGAAINHSWTSKAFTFGEPARGKEFNKIWVEGYIGSGTKIKISVLYGLLGSEGSKSKTLAWNDDFVTTQKISALGADVLGTVSLGASSADITDSYAFSVPIHVDIKKSTRYKIKIETEYDSETSNESYWAVSNLATNPTLKTIDYRDVINTNV